MLPISKLRTYRVLIVNAFDVSKFVSISNITDRQFALFELAITNNK